MTEVAPSRSAILELRDERLSMVEGRGFLDEKCLAIAAEIVKRLGRYREVQAGLAAATREAAEALQGAIARHGLAELGRVPAPASPPSALATCASRVMGVALREASLAAAPDLPGPPPWGSPESRACAQAFARLLALAVRSGSLAADLERLSEAYRLAIRRARALDDVLIPEATRVIAALETGLEDLEREEAVAIRLVAAPGPG